jgi:hypothetical protein
LDSIWLQASAQLEQASAQTRQCLCLSAWRLHSFAQARQKAMHVVSCASNGWRLPALLARAMMLPVAAQTAAQSRFSRMQEIRLSTCFSERQASAQAVQVSTQSEQASMHALMASE